MLKLLLIVGAGGFFGSISRYLASRFIQNNADSSFPYGTFLVNIAGCLLIGIIYGISERFQSLSSEWKLFLTAGFCGGFTTFSTFANENLGLLRDGDIFHFMIYTILSVVLGISAVFFGIIITKIL